MPWNLFGVKMKKNNHPYRIGTRGSKLALWQAKQVSENLSEKTQIIIIKTSGDRFKNKALQGQNETGFFTKEIENQLLRKNIDIAVHSLKDLPTVIHPDLTLAAYLPRGPVPDLLLVHPDYHDPGFLVPVKKGSRIGATSLRRQALLHLYGPHTKPDFLRGNIPTRIQKCRKKQHGAIVLAEAGLRRLGWDVSPLHVYRLNPEIWLPAPGQGVIVVQTRKDDSALQNAASQLDDPVTRSSTDIERQLLANFEGGCHVAFGAYVRQQEKGWQAFIGLDQPGKGWVRTEIFNPDENFLKNIMPGDLSGFQTRIIQKREDLCQKIPS